MPEKPTILPGAMALRIPGGQSWSITPGPRLQEMAMRWNSIVYNRERWDTDEGSADLQKRAQLDLDSIGVNVGVRDLMVKAGMAEIFLTWQGEEHDWEGRNMPWEFVLSLATRAKRKGNMITVWRHLDTGRALREIPNTVDSLAFVDFAPGRLLPHLNNHIDKQLIAASLGLQAQVYSNSALSELGKELSNARPSVIHVTAFDNVEAAQLLGLKSPNRRFGLCVGQGENETSTVNDWVIADVFGKAMPRLVTFHTPSSNRLGAVSIGIGRACAAMGFQDNIDRDVARTFYTEFYRQWKINDFQLHTALIQTRMALRKRSVNFHGAGFLLWTDRSLIDVQPREHTRDDDKTIIVQGTPHTSANSPTARLDNSSSTAVVGKDTAVVDTFLKPCIQVECKPLPRLNYSLLHNDRDLFHRFSLVRLSDKEVSGVCVRVVLSAGGQDVAWKSQLTLKDAITDLRHVVRVPVVAALGTLRESVRSTVFVEITHDDKIIHQSTHPVQLLAGDEWTDDASDRQWLPSFVLPRDPASARIVDQAQRALCTLADDPNVGFDGYQGFGLQDGDDPAIVVDTQIQAIWAALTWDIGLSYVNPPPVYTDAAQRVRSPSAVLDEKRGTCIDLALLLASCWERIGIRPVIILLKGHALPAYWRSEIAWDQFRRGERSGVEEERVTKSAVSWMVTDYEEVVAHIRAQALWPVEATRIPKRDGFSDAVHAGMDALRLASDFDCLIDISIAREKGVLPLP